MAQMVSVGASMLTAINWRGLKRYCGLIVQKVVEHILTRYTSIFNNTNV